jgi:acyl-CoA reductase-like NAD-dependent aldehyde dehydrogenase
MAEGTCWFGASRPSPSVDVTAPQANEHAQWQLKQLWWLLEQNLDRIVDALHTELNRHAFETLTMEVRSIKGDIVDMLEHIDEWSKGEKPDAGFLFGTLGNAWLRKEPLGVTLIIAAWNFPLYTLLSPMVAAIAAGEFPPSSGPASHPVPCRLAFDLLPIAG